MVQYLQKSLNERPPIRNTSTYHPANFNPSSSYSNINRDTSSQISSYSSSNSRVALTSNNRIEKNDKYEPNIKRY